MNYTEHALCRMKQRGVSKSVVEAVIHHGQEWNHKSGVIYHLSNKVACYLIHIGFKACDIERRRNVYVVIQDNFIITVAHKSTKFQR
ncbi:DUF4258 domain-containing protein [Photobacterium rosenbergii]|uniref:DUF4258 domain-containing protein n=1 Tax=Photobacterium rosenbergii TaxID=294936 RepID=UPI001C99A2F4|nr:DUF4258 domain-containing protein [Photobacterium rosenbergii]MBY5944782.1 DUF4258 domain-containing protein [Photobacterium rosenbergii]